MSALFATSNFVARSRPPSAAKWRHESPLLDSAASDAPLDSSAATTRRRSPMILLEFSSVIFGLAVLDLAYSVRLLWPVLTRRETLRERCGFFSFTAGAVFSSCVLALPERLLCMLSDSRLLGPCGTEVVWHIFCWGEIVLLWLFPILIARKVRMLQLGLPLGSPVQMRLKLVWIVWIGVQLIIQLVVAASKGCATPGTPGYTAWAATEMFYLLVYCSPAALAYIYTLWMCRWIRLRDDDENNARLYEQFIELSSTLALLAMPPLFVTGVGFCMQMTIYFTPHLEVVREVVDCIACFLFLSSASIQRAAIMRSICSRNDWHAWERTLESSRLAFLSGDDHASPEDVPSAREGSGASVSEEESTQRMKAIAKLSGEARRTCKAVRLSQFGDRNPFATDMGGAGSRYQEADEIVSPEAEACEPDFFVSHSWRDSPALKWTAIQKVAASFEAEYGREPTFWIDKFCIDQCNITSSLRYLPVYVAMSHKVLLLLGDSYFTRLWCVWELYVIRETSGFAKLLVWTLGSKRLADVELETSRFAVERAGCYLAEDHRKIIHIIDSSSGRANARSEFEHRIVALGRHISAKGLKSRSDTTRHAHPPLVAGCSIDKITVLVQQSHMEVARAHVQGVHLTNSTCTNSSSSQGHQLVSSAPASKKPSLAKQRVAELKLKYGRDAVVLV